MAPVKAGKVSMVHPICVLTTADTPATRDFADGRTGPPRLPMEKMSSRKACPSTGGAATETLSPSTSPFWYFSGTNALPFFTIGPPPNAAPSFPPPPRAHNSKGRLPVLKEHGTENLVLHPIECCCDGPPSNENGATRHQPHARTTMNRLTARTDLKEPIRSSRPPGCCSYSFWGCGED